MNEAIKIKVDDYNGCMVSCQYDGECANHYSAGDFRSDGGMQPKLYRLGNDVFCRTAKMEPDLTEGMHRDAWPKEVHDFGMVDIRNLPDSSDLYEI